MPSKIGIHSIRPQKVLSFVAQAKLKGVTFRVVKAVDDTGTAIEVKKISPSTITITRFVTKDDGMQGLEKWNQADRIASAKKQMDYLDTRTQKKPDILAATDYFEIVNEADPRGFYDFYGLTLIELVKEANARGIHLALPAFNAGTPEWADIVKFRNTGLFKLMKATGHILSIHEGVFGTQPVNQGYGDIIPGAPKVDGAGSLCFRYKYLYSLLGPDELVNCVVSEFRASGENLSTDETVTRLKWYDQLAQKDNYILAVLPFTIDPPANWANQDYTKDYDGIINYMVTQLNNPVPTPIPPIPQPPVSKQLVGLHGRANGRMQPADFACVSTGKIEAVKLLSTAAPEDVDSLKHIKSDMFIMVRLFVDFQNGRVLNPQQFVDSVKDDMRNFYNKGVRYFEIHNEPNIYQEGYSHSWKNGGDFTTWFNGVYNLLKSLFPDSKLGFPGISPGLDIPNVRANSSTFLSQIGIINADWVGVHTYWLSQIELDNIASTLSPYISKFKLPLYITEFSNPSETVSKTDKANQYVQFYSKGLSIAAFSFVSSAPSGFVNETWRNEDSTLSIIPTIVGERTQTMVGKRIGIVNATALNLRDGPSTANNILTVIYSDATFVVKEQIGNWVRLTSNGWVSASYVKVL